MDSKEDILRQVLKETAQPVKPTPRPNVNMNPKPKFVHEDEEEIQQENQNVSMGGSTAPVSLMEPVYADSDKTSEFIPAKGGQEIAEPPMGVDEDLEGTSQAFHGDRGYHSTKKPKRRRKQHRVISALFMTIVILGVSIALSFVLIVYGQDLLGINSDSSTKLVTIEDGADVTAIAETLQEDGIINKPKFFEFIVGISHKDTEIKAGDHELRPDMAYETILSELTSDPMDNNVSVTITFPEGIRLIDAAQMLEDNQVCDADEFMDAFNEGFDFGLTYEDKLPSFVDDKFYSMEGFFFPDTYTFYQDMSVELVAQKVLTNFDSKITQEDYDRMEALNLSLDDTIILASMIQAEAGSVDDMPKISSVFWNRLNNASEYPVLQSDPTTKYVEEVIKPNSQTYNEALYESYDTYQCSGLPAGAICNPGLDAIQAALYPANTNYYYFYANVDTGVTYYAATLEGHYANEEKVKKQQEEAEEASEAAEEAQEEEEEEGSDE